MLLLKARLKYDVLKPTNSANVPQLSGWSRFASMCAINRRFCQGARPPRKKNGSGVSAAYRAVRFGRVQSGLVVHRDSVRLGVPQWLPLKSAATSMDFYAAAFF